MTEPFSHHAERFAEMAHGEIVRIKTDGRLYWADPVADTIELTARMDYIRGLAYLRHYPMPKGFRRRLLAMTTNAGTTVIDYTVEDVPLPEECFA